MQYQKLLEILNENSMGNWSNLLKKQIPDFFSNNFIRKNISDKKY